MRNIGCATGNPGPVAVPLDPSQGFVSASNGGTWDAGRSTIQWDGTTTPTLVNFPAKTSVTLTLLAGSIS